MINDTFINLFSQLKLKLKQVKILTYGGAGIKNIYFYPYSLNTDLFVSIGLIKQTLYT